MTALVMGENNSGKSAFAEGLIERLHASGPLVYIATMLPYGEEGLARIGRHRAMRKGKGYATLELPETLAGAPIPADAGVLLEDASNLLANRMFRLGGEDCAGAVLAEIQGLAAQCRHLVIVTISGQTLSGEYDGETAKYIAALRHINNSLLAACELTVEMRGGEPIIRKGELP